MRTLLGSLLFVFACPSPPPPEPLAEPEPAGPTGILLDGQTLHPQELAEAPPPVREAWNAYEQAWAMVPPVPPVDASVEEYRLFARDRFGTFTNGQVAAVGALMGHYEQTSNPAEALVYAVLAARLLHRASSWMWTVPVPSGPGVNPAASRALQSTMRGGARDLAVYATDAYRKCAEASRVMSDARAGWRADCEARAEMLTEIRTAELGPPPPTAMPDDCADHHDRRVPAPGQEGEGTSLLLLEMAGFAEGIDLDRVRTAVERWARREHQLRAVPAGRRRAAERLVAQGRVTRRGPECAVAPTTAWVLGSEGQKLATGVVLWACEEAVDSANPPAESADAPAQGGEPPVEGSGTEGESARTAAEPPCALLVHITRRQEGGAVETLSASAPVAREASTRALVEAAGSLVGGAGHGEMGSHPRVHVAPIEANPGYALREPLQAIAACQGQPGLSRLRASWTVTPTGAVEGVSVEGVSVEEGAEAVAACVKAEIEALELTCTPSGEAIAMRTSICLTR